MEENPDRWPANALALTLPWLPSMGTHHHGQGIANAGGGVTETAVRAKVLARGDVQYPTGAG